MAHNKHDRVQETTTNAGGTGALTLAGAAAGMRAFGAVKGDGDTFWGLITYGSPVTQWEISLCTYNSGGGTISRGTVVSSSTGATVDFSGSGPKTITDIAPASKALVEDKNGDVPITRDLTIGRYLSGALQRPDDQSNYAISMGRYSSGFGGAVVNTSAACSFVEFQLNGVAAFRYNAAGLGVGGSPSYPFHMISASTAAEVSGAGFQSEANPVGLSFTYVDIKKGASGGGYGGVLGGYLSQGVGSGLALCVLNGGVLTKYLMLESTNKFYPFTDNVLQFGDGSHRVTEVFAVNGAINTSDADEKDNIRSFTPQETAVAVALAGRITLGQWRHALAKKGAAARVHAWITAQDVRDTFIAHSLEPFSYGCVGFDELDKVEHYTETVKRPKIRKVSVAEKVVEIIDGKPVMVIRNSERDESVGAWDVVIDQATGASVIVMVPRDTGQRDEQGQPIIVEEPQPLRHFVPEMEEVEEPRTRVVPDLDENGERRIRMNVRPDQLAMWLAHGFHHRLAAIEARLAP